MAFKKILMPDLGEGVTEGEITKIQVKVGDKISLDDPLVEIMTDKASTEVPSVLDGTIKEVQIAEGDHVPIGQTLFVVETEGPEKVEKEKSQTIQAPPEKPGGTPPQSDSKSPVLSSDSMKAAPSTRKLAKELGISLANLSPSGKEGQILRQDLLHHIKTSSSLVPSSGKPILNKQDEDQIEPVRGIKRLMSETMTLSKQTIPHFTIVEEACMDRLIKLRSQFKKNLEKEGIKLTYLPFIMKACLSELNRFPIFNSQFDATNKEIIYKKSRHLGFAVDTPQGLLVPVIKEAQRKTIPQLAKELQELGQKAREGKLRREELQEGTFTLTNLGSLGGLYGTPIIQPPQVAILGIYRFYKKMENINGNLQEKTYSHFSITCDHRVIDGATATRFLSQLVLKITEPERLLLD